jgi:hypothetical protein
VEGVRRLHWHGIARQDAVAAGGVGPAVAGEEEVGVTGVRQRPVHLVTPPVDAHDEDPDPVGVIGGLRPAADPTVEESKVCFGDTGGLDAAGGSERPIG